jgi:spore coat polysaccharide biosynthesis protein SpsF (cytidylyltransferase family)
MGFDFFWTNRLAADTTDATCTRTFAWSEEGIILGKAKNITTEVDKRADLKNATQVYSYMSCGAVRFEGAQVHECLNKNTD